MGSINDFQALIREGKGLARPARYEIVITPPFNNSNEKNRNVSLLCDTIKMPGHDLQSSTVKYGTAVETEMVTGHGYAGTIEATFYLDQDLDVKSFFDTWQESAVDTETNTVSYYKKDNPSPGESKFNYVGTMQIYQLGSKSQLVVSSSNKKLHSEAERVYGIHVEEVYPVTIGGVEYAYATVDELAKLTVSFQYRKWKEIIDIEAGNTFKRNETLIGTVTEKLAGNGVLTRAEILRKFK